MGNRSLDDFLADAGDEATDETSESTGGDTGDESVAGERSESGDDGPTGGDADEATGGDADEDGAAGPAVPTDEVDPAVSTYVGRAGECAACGETVRRRWRSEDGPVCPACKSW